MDFWTRKIMLLFVCTEINCNRVFIKLYVNIITVYMKSGDNSFERHITQTIHTHSPARLRCGKLLKTIP